MIGRGWKLAALFLMIFLMGFVVWEIRDFGEPSGKPVDRDLDGEQDVGEDGRLVWDDGTGQIDIHDAETNTTIRQDRTMMDDAFLSGAADPNGTVNSNNVVTAIVFDYRGFDTLGEATILFAAVSGVLATIRVAFPGNKGAKGGED
ncbi:MAG: hypothetical protein JXA22_03760 [Candidatus Thermoplasmatota archaeon]|nr:hypothetical protein [Candidatus Thermoplasmatota archaeon]